LSVSLWLAAAGIRKEEIKRIRTIKRN